MKGFKDGSGKFHPIKNSKGVSKSRDQSTKEVGIRLKRKVATGTIPDVNKIIAYEAGELNDQDTIELFAGMIKSGVVWNLQGSYGRMAVGLIESGIISKDGKILKDAEQIRMEEGFD